MVAFVTPNANRLTQLHTEKVSHETYVSKTCGSHTRGIHMSLRYRSHETVIYKNFPTHLLVTTTLI